MKRIYLLALTSILGMMAYGQKEIRVTETAREMSRGLQPSFMVNIPETTLRDVERAWPKHLQRGTRAKVQQDKQEIKISGASIEGVQGGTVTVYSRLFAEKEDVMLYSFFEIDSVFFLAEQDPDKANSIRTYLRGFAVATYQESVKEQLKLEQKKLQSMEKILENLRDEEKKNEKLVRESEREIRELKDAISENTSDQERINGQLESQKDRVDAVKDFEEERAKEEKVLKQLKREKKKMQSQREGMYRKIDKLEAAIKKANRDIRIGQEKQKLQEKENTRQSGVVEAVQRKLEAIR